MVDLDINNRWEKGTDHHPLARIDRNQGGEMDMSEEFEIEWWPPKTTGGMQTGSIPKGVKITHKPTGSVVACNHARNQHQNRVLAMNFIKSLIGEQ